MVKPFAIATSNANGLAKHSQEIKTFIFSQNINILLISKTHFTNKSYCRISGYTMYYIMYSDNKAHGETAFIIRSDIKCYEIGKFQREFLQATSMVVEDRNDCITISATYSPPKHTIKKEQYISFFKTLGKSLYYRRKL